MSFSTHCRCFLNGGQRIEENLNRTKGRSSYVFTKRPRERCSVIPSARPKTAALKCLPMCSLRWVSRSFRHRCRRQEKVCLSCRVNSQQQQQQQAGKNSQGCESTENADSINNKEGSKPRFEFIVVFRRSEAKSDAKQEGVESCRVAADRINAQLKDWGESRLCGRERPTQKGWRQSLFAPLKGAHVD